MSTKITPTFAVALILGGFSASVAYGGPRYHGGPKSLSTISYEEHRSQSIPRERLSNVLNSHRTDLPPRFKRSLSVIHLPTVKHSYGELR